MNFHLLLHVEVTPRLHNHKTLKQLYVKLHSTQNSVLRPKHKYEIQTIINHLNAYYHKLLI